MMYGAWLSVAVFVLVGLNLSVSRLHAQVDSQVPARHLSAVVVTSPGLPIPDHQRVPFLWKVEAIAPMPHPPLVLKWDPLPGDAVPSHFRFTVGLDERDDKTVEITLAKSGRRLGSIPVRFPAQFQLYEFELSEQWSKDIINEGLMLRLSKGSELEVFTVGANLPPEFSPHLVYPGNRPPIDEFYIRLRSFASVQQFGWMEGCVLEGLLDLGELPEHSADREAAEKHLSLFLKDDKLVYESPRSSPSDGRIYGIEATLPFASIARLYPEHPVLQLAIDGWVQRRRANGSIQDGNVLTSEGTYTVAYPMALIAKARDDERLMRDALEQCRIRSKLFDGKEFWRTKDDVGARHDRNWARGIAWQLLGLVRTLEVARDRDDIDDLVLELQRLSRWVMKYQRQDGLWSVIVTEPNLTPDSSGCAGIAAALARAYRLGWLDSEARDSAMRAYRGLEPYLTADGFLRGASQSNKAGLNLQKSDYRVVFQMGMGLYAQLAAALEGPSSVSGSPR